MFVNYNKKELLRSRDESIFLKGEKLLMRQTSDSLILAYDSDQFYTIDSLFIIYTKSDDLNLKYVLALMNSKLLNRQYQKINPEKGRVFAQVKIDYVNELPIIKIEKNEQTTYARLSDIQIENKKKILNISLKFQRLMQRKFNIEKFQKNLQNWHQLTFAEFVKELKKKKVKLSLSEESEWEDYFETEKAKAQTLQSEIDKTDKEIDQMVYALYGLTEEEIGIVEGS